MMVYYVLAATFIPFDINCNVITLLTYKEERRRPAVTMQPYNIKWLHQFVPIYYSTTIIVTHIVGKTVDNIGKET